MRPVYDIDGIQIWHADCNDVLTAIDPADIDLLLTDPPYGINVVTDYTAKGSGGKRAPKSWPRIDNDAAPFNPAQMLAYGRCVLFGANNYASRLPDSGGWLVWDKTGSGRGPANLFGDVELAWSNVMNGPRIFHHLWKGLVRDSEIGKHIHPTQKPVALMRWILEQWSEPGDLILDPYMGSGPIARACADLGRRYIGIEIVEEYVDAAINRLGQTAFDLNQP